MADIERADAVRGKTIRFQWSEGPTKGKVHEHVFHPDGTVEWHESGAPPAGSRGSQGAAEKERPPYGAVKVAEEIYVFRDRSIAGYASGARDWFPVRGTMEVVR